jgi:DNA-binding transcriptional LysR family regulator
LETTLGVKLFERSTRTVALTEAGASWLPLAREALAAVDRADEAARDLAAGHTGRLRVGLAATAALDLTPSLLRAFAGLLVIWG